MRVLISAYAFSPYRGSECAVGWNIVTRLARYEEVTVICGDLSAQMKTKRELAEYFSQQAAIQGLTIEYVAPSIWVQRIERWHRIPGCWGVYYWAYQLWQKQAFKRAQELHAQRPFDVAHQLNMIGYREPGYLWKLGLPFFWGPIGGSPNERLSFWRMFSVVGNIKVMLRTLLNNVQKRGAWRSRTAARVAKKMWAVTHADLETITRIWQKPCTQMLETGCTVRAERFIRSREQAEPLHLVWSGIHTSRKALPILFEALAQIQRSKPTQTPFIYVDILGVGPETSSWKKRVQKMALDAQIIWHGQLDHAQALSIMNRAHALVFTSIKEGTPHVVLEALSLGLPVICHDACGMGVAVKDTCGIKIPLVNPQKSIAGFADAIQLLLRKPEKIQELSRQTLTRADELSWDKIVEEFVSEYRTVHAQ